MHLSVVVPCFNEVDNIAAVVREAAAVGRRLGSRLQIIVVDDGSTDGTAAVLDALKRQVPELETVSHVANRGYGAALRSGLDHARFEHVFLTDGDGQFDLGELAQATPLLTRYDVVLGYRRRRSDGVWRALCGRSWTALVNAVLGLRVRDANCAFKVFPRRLLRTASLRSDGALISAELIQAAEQSSLRIAQIPVSHFPRRKGRQTGASLRVIALAFAELSQTLLRRSKRSRSRRDSGRASLRREACRPRP